MVGTVKQLDDLSVINDSMWDPHPTTETLCYAFRKSRFSVARCPKKKHPSYGSDRRAQHIQEPVIDRDIAARFEQVSIGGRRSRSRLGLD
jgi:hypothetical protein